MIAVFNDNLRMFVQITATLFAIGFLTPVVQAVSSGLFDRAQTCIKHEILYKRLALFCLLPPFPFLSSFLISLLILTVDGKLEPYIKAMSIAFVVLNLVLFRSFMCHRGFKKPKLLHFIFALIPWFLLVIYMSIFFTYNVNVQMAFVVFGVVYISLFDLLLRPRGFKKPKLLYYYIFALVPVVPFIIYKIIFGIYGYCLDLFVYYTNLLFIALGILFLADSILTSFDRGITFNTSIQKPPNTSRSKPKESEVKKDWADEVNKNLKELRWACEKGKKAVKDVTTVLKNYHNKKIECALVIAKYSSESKRFCEEVKGAKDEDEKIKGLEGLEEKWLELTDFDYRERHDLSNPPEATLNDLVKFDDRRKRIVEVYLPEFERATNEIEILLRELGANHESND